MHKGSEHVGKAPALYLKARNQSAQKKVLQTDLEEAVAAEEYERAADLRDQIRRMETGA